MVVPVAVLLTSCAGEGPEGTAEQTWFDQIQNDVFDQGCVSGACHDSAVRAGGLSLAAGESYDELVDVGSTNPAARAAGLLRVEPFSASTSFLVAKIRGNLMEGEGSQMPLGSSPLSEAQILNVEAWVDAGASRDAPPPTAGIPPSGTGGPSYAQVQREVFDSGCVAGPCHNDATRAAGLSLSARSSYEAIVGVEPANANARSDGLLLVAPRAPERSFLLNKLTGELAPGDGGRMPLAGTPLPDAAIALLRAWIVAGARP